MEVVVPDFHSDGSARQSEEEFSNDLYTFDAQKKPTTQSQVGCKKKIYFDKCDNVKCAFAYDRAMLEATHTKLQELLTKSVCKPVSKQRLNAMIVQEKTDELDETDAGTAHENLLFLCPFIGDKTSAYVGCRVGTGS
jgi:hypothetical protein